MTESYNPDDLAAAKQQAAAALTPQTGTAPDAGVVRSAVAAAAPTEIDVKSMYAQIQAMQAKIAAMEAEKASANAPAVVEHAQILAAAVKAHAGGTSPAHAQLRQLADDVTDAASNAAQSGDGSKVAAISEKIATGLAAVDPGPGDHHWFRVAKTFAEEHLPGVAKSLTAPAPAIPAGTVVQGSVTG